MKCKNKHIKLSGMKFDSRNGAKRCCLEIIVTNDTIGKTVSVNDGEIQFTFPADEVANWLN